MRDLCVGQLVTAKAGRDKGKIFIILCIIDDQYVYISDGDTRKVEKPKKKKVKHLDMLDDISYNIRDKVLANEKITNSEIKNIIKSVNISGTGGLITLCQSRM